jgi:hypothetical protein
MARTPALILVVAYAFAPITASGAGLWSPACVRNADQECPTFFMSFVPLDARVAVSIGTACAGGTLRLHRWGQYDAAHDIQQWISTDGTGVTPDATGLCVEVGPSTSEVTVAPAGGTCGEDTPYTVSTAIVPPFTVTDQDDNAFFFTGCQASFHYESPQYHTIEAKNVTASFGGVLLKFSDGHRWGDGFNTGYLYTVYDGSLDSGPFGVSWDEFAQKFTYIYDVSINSETVYPPPSNDH